MLQVCVGVVVTDVRVRASFEFLQLLYGFNAFIGLQPADDEIVISKQYPSAFFGTSLASTLQDMSIDTLIITGVTTSGCIRATCVDTMSHGFIPIVVEDACGDRHEEPHAANLFDMNAKYADVVNEAEAIDYLKLYGKN